MSRELDIDALAALSRDNPEDVQAKAELWEAVVKLPSWFLFPVSRGEDISPLLLDVTGKKMIAAFTDSVRARDYALSQGYSEEEAQRVLQIPTPRIKKFFDAWEGGGAWGFIFNPASPAFTAPFASLTAMITLAWSTVTDDES